MQYIVRAYYYIYIINLLHIYIYIYIYIRALRISTYFPIMQSICFQIARILKCI